MSADVNTLLGLDVSGEDGNGKGSGKDRPTVAAPDVQSVPGSPLVENASLSSFGSGSSMPSSASRFGADEGGARLPETAIGCLEEQFGKLGIGAGGGNRQDESFLPHSVFPQTPTGAINSTSKDEKVEQSSPMAKITKSPPQTPMQAQQKQVVLDFLTDAVVGPAGAVPHTKRMFYQDSSAVVAVEEKISAATSAANPVLDGRRDGSQITKAHLEVRTSSKILNWISRRKEHGNPAHPTPPHPTRSFPLKHIHEVTFVFFWSFRTARHCFVDGVRARG